MFEIDHLAVSADTLAEATTHVEAALGVALGPMGFHPLMGTHNRLLSLGPELYLEAIAIDPDAPDPVRARWFDLDRRRGPARIGNWIARCDDLADLLDQAPAGMGQKIALQRADFSWEMAVPDDGILPFDGAAPALIEWHGGAHPAPRLPDQGCRLTQLVVQHPRRDDLLEAFPALRHLKRVSFEAGAAGFRAEITTPRGPMVLT